LPVSQGYDSILTITDQGCTKAAIFIPCNEDITVEETAALYIKHVFAHFGLPTKVISDRDPRFMSKFIQCYGRLAVVSDVDDEGFALNVDKRVAEICRAISKQVQRSDAGIEVDVMHTGNELRYRALDKGLYDKRMYCRALDKGLQERREGVQGLDK
jgi:hypothetical protein